jgi:hypothetical protein
VARKALRVYFGGLIKGCNKKAFYQKYAVANSTRSQALSASEKKPPRDARVVEEREDSKYYGM